MTPARWFSAREASIYLDFPTLTAFQRWVQRERKRERPRLRVHWIGRRMRFRQTDLDACVEVEPQRRAVEQRPRLVR